MNTDPLICPTCGAALEAAQPGGLCPRCLMAGAMIPTDPATGVRPNAPPTVEQVAAAFPQLEVLALIGAGGMGAVFRARQPKLNRLVALKVLPASLAERDPAFAERFEREGQMLARLHHPNIVAVHDSGRAGEFFYLLMEYVDGVNLRQAMRASRFTAEQALGIVPRICDALQFAHDEGVLHRDIKPENILLDAKGRVKLADFGIGKMIGEASELAAAGAPSATHDATLTQAGSALGTPQYMSPEQRDTPGDVDHRSDIYSLGVVFYELLTGELPIGKFAPPSKISASDPRVDAIVRQALERQREHRQQSADEVRTQVETVTAGSVQAPAETPMATKKFRKRMLRLTLVSAGLLLLGGIGLLIAGRILPPVYLAKVTMEVKPDDSQHPSGRARDSTFIATQFQILQKTEVLYQAIENLKLVQTWSADGRQMSVQAVYQELLHMLELNEIANTGLIEIGIYSTNAQEAANLANTIAVVYRQKRRSDLQKNLNEILEPFRDEVDKQRKRVEEALAEAAVIRERDGIVDADPDRTDATFTAANGQTNRHPYVEAKTRSLQAKRIYESAQMYYAEAILKNRIDFDPARIWEKAEPAVAPVPFGIRRLRHAFAR
jgi:serine/threonine protein kinase